MLIKLKKDWSSYKAGQIVAVYNSKGQQMIRDSIGFDSEKPIVDIPKPRIVTPVSVVKKPEKVENESFGTKTILQKDKSKISGKLQE